jgi:hypothetical protein
LIVLFLAPSKLLFLNGFEFSILGWILNHLLEKVPGAMVNDLKNEDKSNDDFPYHLTQLNYSFLYSIVGISLIGAKGLSLE